MAKNIKETLLSTLVHGEEILENIEVMRKVSPNKITGEIATKASDAIHPQKLNLVVSEIIETDKDAIIIRFAADEDSYLPPFEAGQYINIFTVIDGVRTSRPYSISSSPKQRGYYEITVAGIQDGFVSNYFLNEVKIGDKFEANGPAGVFRFHPVFHSKKSLFLAGGSGITPFLSMTREIIETAQDRDIVMLYGSRNLASALYYDELKAYADKYDNFKLHLVISDKDDSWTGETGFIDKKLISKLVPDYAERTAYICGPQIMNDFCVSELKGLGLPEKQIRREMFGAKRDITQEPGWPEELTGQETFKITIGDRVIDAKSGESVLTALERAGERVNVCCRSGECSLCRVQLISGNVFLAKGMLRRLADEKFGYIHSCKAYPISDIEIAK